MTKVFVKQAELKLVNGGYVATGEDDKLVSNTEFNVAQGIARKIVTFAEKCKDKDFVGKTPDSITSAIKDTMEALSTPDTVYVEAPSKPKSTTIDKLKKEAMGFIEFGTESTKTDKINTFMQKFNVINDFEKVGLYFDLEMSKLNKIYTIEEIKAAVKSTIDMLDVLN